MDTTIAPPAGGEANVYLRDCPSRTVLELLSDKWVLLLVCALAPGPRRFGALRRRLGGITQKMLTQTLRSLERDGLVVRTVYATMPPSVEYALTELGMSATVLLEQVRLWSEAHVAGVLAARRAHGAAQAAPPPAVPVSGVRPPGAPGRPAQTPPEPRTGA